jgi:hypothetical protein
MDEQNKKNSKPSVGFYDEPGFVSLTTSLRKINGDDTLPTDSYVDIYKNIYDLITPDGHISTSGVLDISLSNDKKEFIIYYVNDTIKKIPLEDNFLYQVYYDNISKLIYFILSNGSKITLDLNFLNDLYATKEDVNEIHDEINELEKNIEEMKSNIETISNIIDEGVDVKWKSF